MTSWPELIPNRIGGKDRAARTGKSFEVINPHNGEILTRLSRSDASDVADAVAAAREAQRAWADTPAARRGHILHQACNLLEENQDKLSSIVAAEAGKRSVDAKGETGGAISCGRFFAGEGQRLFGRTMGSGVPARVNMTMRMPCGVAALITAANTPAPNFAWKVFPALISGNGVVLKPAEDTPISAWFMAKTLEEAGLPAGVLNVVHGYGAEVGPPLVEHDDVDVISFTGSTDVGRRIAKQAGPLLKKVSLELGGKNPFVVWDDADLDKAVKWVAASAFSNAGQRCAAASRIIVHEAVHDAFLDKLLAAAKSQKLGIDDDCDLGPVINKRQIDNMIAAIERAVQHGAKVLIGGKRATGQGLDNGFYMEPTLLKGADPDAEISGNEIFGPVANVYKVSSFPEAIALANNSPYGLTSAIHTRDFDRAMTFCRKVSAGVVTVNGGTFGSEPHMPFGGVRASGNGTREPGTEALDVYTELRDIYLNIDPEFGR